MNANKLYRRACRVALMMALCSAPVSASPLDGRVRALFDDANGKLAAGRAPEALEVYRKLAVLLTEFEETHAGAMASVMWGQAKCLRALERYGEARAAARESAKLYALSFHPDARRKQQRSETFASEMEALLFGSMSVTCGPPELSAVIELIGPHGNRYRALQCRELKEDLPVGMYQIIGESPDGLQATDEALVRGNRKTTVHLEFPAGLRVNGVGGYPVYIDDVPIGGLPAGRDDLTPGYHTIRVELPDQAPFIETKKFPPGERIELTVTPTERPVALPRIYVPPPEPDDELRAALPWVLGVGALSVGAIGGVFLYNAASAEDRAHSYAASYARACPLTEDGTRPAGLRCDQELLESTRIAGERALDEARLDRTIGWVAIGASAALLGAATWTFIDAWPAPIGRLDVSLDGTGAALWLTGEF